MKLIGLLLATSLFGQEQLAQKPEDLLKFQDVKIENGLYAGLSTPIWELRSKTSTSKGFHVGGLVRFHTNPLHYFRIHLTYSVMPGDKNSYRFVKLGTDWDYQLNSNLYSILGLALTQIQHDKQIRDEVRTYTRNKLVLTAGLSYKLNSNCTLESSLNHAIVHSRPVDWVQTSFVYHFH